MITVYELNVKKVVICKEDGQYYVMESSGFNHKTGTPGKYDVVYKSNNWRAARRYANNYSTNQS